MVFLNCFSNHTTVCIYTASGMLNTSTESPTHLCFLYTRTFCIYLFPFSFYVNFSINLKQQQSAWGLGFRLFSLVVFFISHYLVWLNPLRFLQKNRVFLTVFFHFLFCSYAVFSLFLLLFLDLSHCLRITGFHL